MNPPSNFSCCLICSIQSSLSHVNCCSKHLSALHRTMPSGLPTQIVYMMPSAMNEWSKEEWHCLSKHSKPKRHYRSRSSHSSSSTKSQPRGKRRSIAVPSIESIENNAVRLPSTEEECGRHIESQKRSTTQYQRRSKNLRTPLSPLLQSYSLMNSNANRNDNNKSIEYNLRSSTPIVTKSKQQNKGQTESTIEYRSRQSDCQEINNERSSSPVYSPRIILSRTIHVKEEGEEMLFDYPQITLDMDQATEQMAAQTNLKPKIILQRVSLEPYMNN